MNQTEAAQRVDWHIHAAADPLGLQLIAGLKSTMDCIDPSDHGPLGRVTVEHQYRLAPSDTRAVLDGLAAYWESHGYRFLRDERGKRLAEIAVETQDGFAVVVTTNIVGELSIIGSSPCIWP